MLESFLESNWEMNRRLRNLVDDFTLVCEINKGNFKVLPRTFVLIMTTGASP